MHDMRSGGDLRSKLAGLMGSLVLVAACSSGATNAPPSSSGSPASTPSAAATPEASASAPAPSLDPIAAAVAAAKAEVDKYSSAPTAWPGPTTGPKPIPGKTLAIVASGLQSEGSARPTRAAQAAATKIGWKAVVYDGNNQQLKDLAAVNAAVDAKSDAIILVLIDPNTIGAAVQRALDAKIPVVTVGVPPFIGSGRARDAKWDSIPDISWDFYQQGHALANYMIWKSGGHLDVYIIDVPDFAAISSGQTAGGLDVFNDKTKCPDCTIHKTDISVAEFFNQIPTSVVAAVQADPKINWLYLLDAGLEVEINALSAANLLGTIQGGGFDCNAHNLDFIKNGKTEAVCMAESSDWTGWAAVDAANRMMQGQQPYTAGYPAGTTGPGPNYTIPILIIDKTNVGSLTPADLADGWQGGIDFRSAYLKVWGVQ